VEMAFTRAYLVAEKLIGDMTGAYDVNKEKTFYYITASLMHIKPP
jgi:hypothetical protein